MRHPSCIRFASPVYASAWLARTLSAVRIAIRRLRSLNWFGRGAAASSFSLAERSELLLDIRERHLLRTRGEAVLGTRNWRLFYGYGRIMGGQFSGLYVSGIPSAAVHQLLDALFRGERIAVHLMHRHTSGNYESSVLLLVNSELAMEFADRTVPV